MQKRTIAIPPDVQMVIVTMGTLAHRSLQRMSADEVAEINRTNQAEHERITAEHGDFTSKIRDEKVDNGQQLVDGYPLYTGEMVAQLKAAGFRMIDAYAFDKPVKGKVKPNNVAIFSNVPEMAVNARVTDEVADAIRSVATKNWYQSYIWYNPLWRPVSMTINVSGNLNEGVAENLVLVASTVAADQPA